MLCVIMHNKQPQGPGNALRPDVSLTGRESRELLAKVVLGMILPLPFGWVALSLCHVAVLFYASDLKMPAVQWRAAGALQTFLALLVMELAEGETTCTLIVVPFFVAHMGFAQIVNMHRR